MVSTSDSTPTSVPVQEQAPPPAPKPAAVRVGGRVSVAALIAIVLSGSGALALLVRTAPPGTAGDAAADAWWIGALVLITIVAGSATLAGVRGSRWWVVAASYAAAGRAVFGPDLSPDGTTGVWIAAVVWGVAAGTLAALPAVGRYVRYRWERRYDRLLGPLRTAADADRWRSILDRWDEAGVVSRGERSRIERLIETRRTT